MISLCRYRLTGQVRVSLIWAPVDGGGGLVTIGAGRPPHRTVETSATLSV